MRGVNVELSGRISDIAMGKKAEILKILQGVSVEDALDSLNTALSIINLFTSEMNKKTLFDKQVIDDFLNRPVSIVE